jgi:hypothetical protein
MATPILYFTSDCCDKLSNSSSNKGVKRPSTFKDVLLVTSLTADALISITCVVLGILGLLSVIAMPAAAAYTLIGVSGGITLLWLALTASFAKCAFSPKQKLEKK